MHYQSSRVLKRLFSSRHIHTALQWLVLALFYGNAAYSQSDSASMQTTSQSYSFYMISCGSYVEHRASPKSEDDTADTFYVAGWISAYNRLSSNAHNFTEDTDLDSIMFWLEKYCHENPLSNLEAGLYHLSLEHPIVAPPTSQEQPPAVKSSPQSSDTQFHELPY